MEIATRRAVVGWMPDVAMDTAANGASSTLGSVLSAERSFCLGSLEFAGCVEALGEGCGVASDKEAGEDGDGDDADDGVGDGAGDGDAARRDTRRRGRRDERACWRDPDRAWDS